MATLRKWLNAKGFDWESGRIILHGVDSEETSYPGWASASEVVERGEIDATHPILDLEFDNSFGGPEAPRIFARDKNAVYFPGQYDGSTWPERMVIDPDHYLKDGTMTPYPGG